MKTEVNVFWFRRDLRLDDNSGLYHALKSGLPVLPVFIFDRDILDKLADKDDSRVTFIYKAINELNIQLKTWCSSILVKYNFPINAWEEILKDHNVRNIYTNHDYEPYACKRDSLLLELFKEKNVGLNTYKDQVIFEKSEIVKDDNQPYTVFTPYKRKWLDKLNEFYIRPYPTKQYFDNFFKESSHPVPSLESMGFENSKIAFPDKKYNDIISNYKDTRNFPGINGTSRISVHLRFGTISIRKLTKDANSSVEKTWLNELIWRDFYAMILWHFPYTVEKAFKPQYDQIDWRNDPEEFTLWCEGKTGFPIVDAGMRELNATGFMHNRVRMVTASFLSKHLLIDWRWGEAYFARKLLDYDQASNVGGWQWAASSGNDSAPYFRVFNPDLQTQKFDPKLEYIKKWIPEFDDPFKYPRPMVDHKLARERVLKAFKLALSK